MKASDKINYLRDNNMFCPITEQLIASLLSQVLENLKRVVRSSLTMSFDIETKYLTSWDTVKATPTATVLNC